MLTGLMMASLSISAQRQTWPFELWYEGKIVLDSGDTLRGLVKYDLQKDVVEYTRNDRSADVFTARKAVFFEIFDEKAKHYRRFFALPYEATAGYRTPVFFELLEEGKLTLLAREFLEYRTNTSPYFYGYSTLVLDHKFYFLHENGTIDLFSGNKNDLFEMMGKYSDEVQKFIRKNRLRLDDRYDFARIIDYYNSLFGF